MHIQYKWQTLLIRRPDFRTIECKESDPRVTAKVGSIVSVGNIDWSVWSWTLTVSLLVKSCYSADCVQCDLVCRIPAVQIVRWNLSFVRNSEDSEVIEFDSQSSPNIMGSDPVFESAMGILEGEVVVKNKKAQVNLVIFVLITSSNTTGYITWCSRLSWMLVDKLTSLTFTKLKKWKLW